MLAATHQVPHATDGASARVPPGIRGTRHQRSGGNRAAHVRGAGSPTALPAAPAALRAPPLPARLGSLSAAGSRAGALSLRRGEPHVKRSEGARRLHRRGEGTEGGEEGGKGGGREKAGGRAGRSPSSEPPRPRCRSPRQRPLGEGSSERSRPLAGLARPSPAAARGGTGARCEPPEPAGWGNGGSVGCWGAAVLRAQLSVDIPARRGHPSKTQPQRSRELLPQLKHSTRTWDSGIQCLTLPTRGSRSTLPSGCGDAQAGAHKTSGWLPRNPQITQRTGPALVS